MHTILDIDERRAHGRIDQPSLESDHGRVIDLSRGGMRIEASRRFKGFRTVILDSEEGLLPIACRVAWNRKLGFRRFETGFEFIHPDQTLMTALARIATQYPFSLAG